MSDGIVITPEVAAKRTVQGESDGSPSSVVDASSGTAGIFVERSGSRKIPLSSARIVLPKFTTFFQSKGALEDQDSGETIMRDWRQESSSGSSASFLMHPLAMLRSGSSSSHETPQHRFEQQEQEAEVMVACAMCGTYEMRSEENDSVHQPFICHRCDAQMSIGMVGAQNLEPLEEKSEHDDISDLEEDDTVAIAEELQRMGVNNKGLRSDGDSFTASQRSLTMTEIPPPPPTAEQTQQFSPIRRFFRRLSASSRSTQSENDGLSNDSPADNDTKADEVKTAATTSDTVE